MFWGPISQVEVLNVEEPDMTSKPFSLQGQAGSCELLPCYVLLHRGFYGEIVSQPLLHILCGFSLGCLMCRSSSASFWIFFRGNFPVYSWRFAVSTGRGELRSLLYHHLEPDVHICFSQACSLVRVIRYNS